MLFEEKRGLVCCLADFAEMADDFAEVLCAVYLETIPDGTEQYDSTKSVVAQEGDVLQVYAAHSHHFLVNHLSLAHRLDLCGREAWRELLAVCRFIEGGEEKIVEGLFALLDFLFGQTGTTDLSFVLGGEFVVALVEMDALEAVFVLEIKMIVNDDLLSIVIRQEL